jgi:hypothetical protein
MNTHVTSDNKFVEKYVKRMVDLMCSTNPDWDKKKVKKIVLKMIEEQIENPRVILDNNYTGENRDTTLLSLLNWIIEREPIIAGNGTFYKNQNEALNPIAVMLDEWADNRKRFKKEMFKIGETMGFDVPEYADADRRQNNEKINMNSYYGGSGAKSSAFYSKWSGPATTLTAQSVISTAETMFEGFLADNYKFLNLTEALEWIHYILKEDVAIDDFVNEKSIDSVIDRILPKIIDKNPDDGDILYNYLLSLSDDEITRIYYKNNMIEFIKDHSFIQDIMLEIFESVENLEYADESDKEWLQKIPSEYISDFNGKEAKAWNKFVNKQFFMDPNDPPKEIKSTLIVLSSYLMKYCYCRYLSVDRIYRLKNFKRRVVTVIDTDSNFLSLDTLINYIFDDVVKGNTFGRDKAHNEFIAVNTITYVITDAIYDMLIHYGKFSNIPEDYRPRFNMKNEFFNTLLVIGKTKKRYISKQKLREGNLLTPPKADIKGFDFKKATTSEYAEAVFMKLIKDHILNSEKIELKEMVIGIKKFKEEIKQSIMAGERKFLPNGSAKELGAYKNPATNQSVRAALAWNLIYPNNQIDFPSKISLVKMNIFTEEDMADLEKTHPEIYDIIIEKIFNDKTGMFVTTEHEDGISYVNPKDKEWFKHIPKKYRTKYKKLGAQAWNEFVDSIDFDDPKYADAAKGKTIYKKKGLQVLGIPSNATIPEWALPYIDYSTMVNNIVAPFMPVLEIFGSQFTEEGRSRNGVNRKTKSVTNIIKF